MFTVREYHLLCILSGADFWVSGTELSEMLKISKRMLQMEILAINEEIARMKLPDSVGIISHRHDGYHLEDAEGWLREALLRYEDEIIRVHKKPLLGKRIMTLLLFEKDYINIDTLADRLYYSKPAINMELVYVKRAIRKQKASQLAVSSSKGIRIEMAESMKRVMCMKVLCEDPGAIEYIPGLKEMSRKLPELKKAVTNCFIEHLFVVTGDSLQRFLSYLMIGVIRSRLGFLVEPVEISQTPTVICLEIVEILKTHLEYTATAEEVGQINLRLQEMPELKTKQPEDTEKAGKILTDFIEVIEEKTGLPLQMTASIRKYMTRHIARMLLRVQSGHTIYGKYTREMYRAHPLETHLLKVYFCRVAGQLIPDSELSYLVMYLAQVFEYNRPKLKVALISDQVGSITYSLRDWLLDYLGCYISNIKIVPVYLYESGRALLDGAEVFLTTEYRQVLKGKNFVYLDFESREQQLERLKKLLLEAQYEQRKAQLSNLNEDFRAGTKEIIYEKPVSNFQEMFQDLGLWLSLSETSVVTVDEDILCVVSYKSDGENILRIIRIKESFICGGKKIKTTFYVQYHGGKDTVFFFNFVKQKMSEF